MRLILDLGGGRVCERPRLSLRRHWRWTGVRSWTEGSSPHPDRGVWGRSGGAGRFAGAFRGGPGRGLGFRSGFSGWVVVGAGRRGRKTRARLLPISVRLRAIHEKLAFPFEVVARRLVELQRLLQGLSEVIQAGPLGGWLKTPNSALAGLKPLEVIERGESDRLWSMIFFLRSDVAS